MVSAEEELNLPLSPAMDALLRVHKRIIDVDTNFAHATSSSVGTIITRVLVADTQAGSLIGKQGSTIKSIQDASNCTIRVLSAGILEKYYFPYKNVRLLFFFLFEDFEILFLFPHPPPKHPPPPGRPKVLLLFHTSCHFYSSTVTLCVDFEYCFPQALLPYSLMPITYQIM